MSTFVTPAIPASQIVNVLPSVLPAGGSALDLILLMLTQSNKVPIGLIASFADAADVGLTFGATSQEAGLATVYFNGPDNSTVSPAALLVAQYPEAAVGAYLRSGVVSGIPLATLQAINASLTITIDGESPLTDTVNLSAATSFSNAAQIIAGDMGNLLGPQQATGTASLATTVMTVTVLSTGKFAPGQCVTGTGIPVNIYIVSQATGTPGGVGTYNMSASMTTEAPEAVVAFAPGVVYDAILGCFEIYSDTTGATSSVSFGSGAAATSLLLTQALGAVQSPGADAGTPAAFWAGIMAITQDFASLMTTWEPSDAEKELWATVIDGTKNQFVYEMWETNILDTETGGPSAPVNFINNGDLSGIEMIYQSPTTILNGEKAAFAAGWTASLDFSRLGGRQTAAFKSQAGLLPDVVNGSQAILLAGSPMTASFGFGMNFYGKYTTRNQGFNEWQRGLISGPFLWKDSYVNQIWLNNALQLAIMVGLKAANSVPYNAVGAARIESWIMDPVNAAVNFGAIVAGVVLSQAQIDEVNAAAGLIIDQVLFQRGWYVQVKPAAAQARRGRTSPPCTLFYADGGSVQSINLASIEIQ